MTTISESQLRSLVDFDADTALIRDALRDALDSDDAGAPAFLRSVHIVERLLRVRVASLAGKIGRARRLLIDPVEPFVPAADRSVLVASYFFDAARDEFDDHETAERDPHRSLAQAFLKGLARTTLPDVDVAGWNALADDPLWLTALNGAVATGYGARGPDDLATLFSAMGYHLGSEVLADQEFSIIDATLTSMRQDLVAMLEAENVRVGPELHNAYVWIRIHSGSGGAAEADHFAWATKGVNLAFQYVDASLHDDLHRQVERGFLDFARDQREFFSQVNK